MSIFNTLPDPDMPVLNGAGFQQHICQPQGQMASQQFYYNGMQTQPIQSAPAPTFGFNQQPTDSRRYDAPAQQSMPVSPWSQQPTQPQPTFGFNQMVEQSRRDMMVAPTQPAPTPWSIQPQTTVVAQAPMCPAQYDPRYSAVYNCHPSFDKKQGVWGNTDVTLPVTAPTVNWNAPVQQPVQQPAQQGYVSITYPMTAQPMQEDWMEIVRKNFPQTK